MSHRLSTTVKHFTLTVRSKRAYLFSSSLKESETFSGNQVTRWVWVRLVRQSTRNG